MPYLGLTEKEKNMEVLRNCKEFAQNNIIATEKYTFRIQSPDESKMVMVHVGTVEEVKEAVKELSRRRMVLINTQTASKEDRALVEAYLKGYISGSKGFMKKITDTIFECSESLDTIKCFYLSHGGSWK